MKRFMITAVMVVIGAIGVYATTVSIEGDTWKLDDAITYPGTPAEGLLMNARMVNSTFENKEDKAFRPIENMKKFTAKIPEYHSYGIRAFTLNLQGGMPGYEGAVNSAFRANGSLKKNYLKRIKRVIEECDKHGVVVILGLFYQRQDQILEDEQAVKNAVVNAVKWIQENEFTNVAVEIANEYDHGGYDYDIILSVEGELELIRLAKETGPGLLVSTSGLGHGRMDESIAKAVDFILIHFNGTKVEDIAIRIQALKKFGKPIVCNEDDKVGEEGAQALKASVEHGCSWGYMNKEVNQFQPFVFDGFKDDPVVYRAFKEATSR